MCLMSSIHCFLPFDTEDTDAIVLTLPPQHAYVVFGLKDVAPALLSLLLCPPTHMI